MATLSCIRSVGTNLTLTCPFPKSFVCNLPDSGRHVTSIYQGLCLSRSMGQVGENPGNEVAYMLSFFKFIYLLKIHNDTNLSALPLLKVHPTVLVFLLPPRMPAFILAQQEFCFIKLYIYFFASTKNNVLKTNSAGDYWRISQNI